MGGRKPPGPTTRPHQRRAHGQHVGVRYQGRDAPRGSYHRAGGTLRLSRTRRFSDHAAGRAARGNRPASAADGSGPWPHHRQHRRDLRWSRRQCHRAGRGGAPHGAARDAGSRSAAGARALGLRTRDNRVGSHGSPGAPACDRWFPHVSRRICHRSAVAHELGYAVPLRPGVRARRAHGR